MKWPPITLWQWMRGGWLKLVPTEVLLVAGSILTVCIWGGTGQLFLRQQLDWWVTDLFMRHKSAAPLDDALVQISLDDLSAAQIPVTDRRHTMATVIQELAGLGAHTIMVDVLYLEEGSEAVFMESAAPYEGVPIHSSAIAFPPELGRQYTEDRLLTKALSVPEAVVLPFLLLPELDRAAAEDRFLVAAMRSALEAALRNTLDSEPLDWTSLNVNALRYQLAQWLSSQSKEFDQDQIDRAFKPALDHAARTLVHDNLPLVLNVLARFGPTDHQLPVVQTLSRTLARRRSEDALRFTSSFAADVTPSHGYRADSIEVPPARFSTVPTGYFAELREDDVLDWSRIVTKLSPRPESYLLQELLSEETIEVIRQANRRGRFDVQRLIESINVDLEFAPSQENVERIILPEYQQTQLTELRRSLHASAADELALATRRLNTVLLSAVFPEEVLLDESQPAPDGLRLESIRDWKRFCAKTESAITCTPCQRIFELLPPAGRTAVQRLSTGSPDKEAAQTTLLDAINKAVLANPYFYQETHFESQALPAATRARVAKVVSLQRSRLPLDDHQRALVRRVGRDLLEEACFPAEIAKRSHANVTLGFANAAADDDGTLRYLPLIGQWNQRLVVHQGLAAVARFRGQPINKLSLTPRQQLRVAPGLAIPLDQEGRVMINWPELSQVRQVPVSALLSFANLKADVARTRHNLREQLARIDQLAALGPTWEGHLSAAFAVISAAYAEGRIFAAQQAECEFDRRFALGRDAAAYEYVRRDIQALIAEKPSNPELLEAGHLVLSVLDARMGLPAMEQQQTELRSLLRSRVSGKLSLLGETSTGSVDLKRTPVGQEVPGVTAILAAVNTVLTRNFIHVPGYRASAVAMILLSATMSIAFVRLRAAMAALSALLSVAIVFGFCFLLLQQFNILLSPVTPMIGLAFCQFTISMNRWWVSSKQRRTIRAAFQYYLHPSLVDQLSREPDRLKLGGQEEELTVLFSDIRGFSSISEQLTAPELVSLLNEYLTAMTDIVLREKGCLDKYIGDALMAIYGAPVIAANHPYLACHSAITMMQTLRELRRAWSDRGLPLVDIGIGINTGTMVVGNMGSKARFDYTVMGDEVNLASRLEGANKQYGTNIIVSESTWNKVRHQLRGRELDVIRVKGKEKPCRIIELLGDETRNESEWLAIFQEALTEYRQRRWLAALARFKTCLEFQPEDVTSQLYVQRCEKFQVDPPSADWDGVYTMETK